MASVIIRNISFNFASEAWLILLSFITLPFIVRGLGTDGFGVLTLVQVVTGYFALLELGFGAALIKYVAEYHAVKDERSLAKVIGTLTSVYGLIGLVGGLLMWASAGFLVHRVLHIPPGLEQQAVSAFQVGALGFFFSMSLSVYGAIPTALQRMDLTGTRNILLGTVNILGTLALLYLGKGLVAVVAWNIALDGVALAMFVAVSKRLLPKVSFGFRFDRPIFRGMFRFSLLRSVSSFNAVLLYRADRLVVGMFLPISAVTYYTVSLKLVQRAFFFLSNNIVNAIFPALSEMGKREEKERLRALYLRASRVVFTLSLPVAVVFVVFGPRILGLWMGEDFAREAGTLFRWLAVGHLLVSCANVPGGAAIALGRPGIPALFSTVSSLLNTGFALVLVWRFGVVGMAWALIGNVLAQQPIFMARVNREVVGISSTQFVKESYLKPLVAGLVMTAFFLVLSPFSGPLPWLLAILALGALLYVGVCWLDGTFDGREKAFILRLLGLAPGR